MSRYGASHGRRSDYLIAAQQSESSTLQTDVQSAAPRVSSRCPVLHRSNKCFACLF